MAVVADPDEGVAADGTIRTGARRDRVPALFEVVLSDAVAAAAADPGASLYLYGSVATGTARPGSSDIDLLSIGLGHSAGIGRHLSERYAGICRGVEVAAATPGEIAEDTDAGYGFRVFLRHYCVHLAGADLAAALPAFPADARAARGFNGNIAQHRQQWSRQLASGAVTADVLGRRAARKALLAVAGLVSVHDGTWTTDRQRAVERWSDIEPGVAADLGRLLSWALGEYRPTGQEVERALAGTGIVAAIVERFRAQIGLWAEGGRK